MTDVKRLDRYVRFSVTPCFSLGRDKTLYFLLPLCYHLICTSVLIASDDRSRIQHNDDHVAQIRTDAMSPPFSPAKARSSRPLPMTEDSRSKQRTERYT